MKLNMSCPACEADLQVEVENIDETDPLICLECGVGLDLIKSPDGEWDIVEET